MLADRLLTELTEAMQKELTGKRHRLALYAERFRGLSPLEKLSQGFSYVTDRKGHTVTQVSQAVIGDTLQIRVKDGKILARVEETKPERKQEE